MIKTILIPATGSDDDALGFETALAAGKAFQSHLQFLHVSIDPIEVVATSLAMVEAGGGAVAAGWIEEEKRSDYRRTLFLEPAAQTLLEALRAIVSQNIASFTGKLRLVCDRLAALSYPHSREDLPWEELKNCLVLVRAGLRELRTIRKQVERYAQRQLKTASIAEALDIIYGEFSALITQQCYRELIHARLPERL